MNGGQTQFLVKEKFEYDSIYDALLFTPISPDTEKIKMVNIIRIVN